MTCRDDTTSMVYMLLQAADEQYAVAGDKKGVDVL